MRLFKVLKPLRVIHRAPGLKLVVQSLLISLKPIGNIVLICCTFFLIFGILGVQVRASVVNNHGADLQIFQLFKGMFFYCEGPEIAGRNIDKNLIIVL